MPNLVSRLHSLQATRLMADYGGVRSRTFADVLDDALGITAGPGISSSRGVSTPTFSPVSPFLFFRLPADAGRRVTYESATAKHARTQAIAVAPEPAGFHQPARTLTVQQQRALDQLTALGARLTADFTFQELRREYRQLARRIHPDRHNHCTASERERLSRQFAELSDSYRHLLAATATMN